jgi:hypothetical protein
VAFHDTFQGRFGSFRPNGTERFRSFVAYHNTIGIIEKDLFQSFAALRRKDMISERNE